jgi:hypothetical protein
VAAYDEAQVLQKKGKYVEAGKRALGCTNTACGDVVTAECTKVYELIAKATPTVVLAARDPDQNDLVNVRASVDGVVVRDQLDGVPLSLDPGVHVFRFEAPNLPPVERSQIVHAGEKLRIVSVTLGEPKPPLPVQPQPPFPVPAIKEPNPMLSRSAAVATGIVGGLGLLAVGGFGLLRWSAGQDYDHLSSTCGVTSTCNPSDVDSLRNKYVLSDVLLGVGAAGVVTATGLLIARGAAGRSTQVQVAPSKTGATAELLIRF